MKQINLELLPLTNRAVIQKILEVQSRHGNDIEGFPEGMEDDTHFCAGFKHGFIICLLQLFEITPDDFK